MNQKIYMNSVKFLPPNIKSIIQPMDQQVIAILNRTYKNDFLDAMVKALMKIKAKAKLIEIAQQPLQIYYFGCNEFVHEELGANKPKGSHCSVVS